MDDQRFDILTRIFATCSSRRQALSLLAAIAVAGGRPRRVSAAQADAPAPSCEAGLTYCPDAGACVDLQSDLNNCGACGEICESGLVAVDCRGGECVRADCPVGLEYCGAVDLCRDLSTDPSHCGACANACASGVCTGGVCAPGGGGCAEGQTECAGVCVDTCCNNDHCGACGNVCTGGLTCFEGVCDCPSGLCPPVKLPNTGRGGTDLETGGNRWAALAMTGAAAVSALMWRASSRWGVAEGREDR